MFTGRNNRGFSLMELLIAMTLGLLMMMVMMKLYSGAKHSYLLQDGLTRVQEDGRIAINLIAKEVRKAGFRKPVWNDPVVGYSPLTAASINGASDANDTLQIMYMDAIDCRGVLNVNLDPDTTEARALYKRVTFAVDNAENLLWTCEYGTNPDALAAQVSNQVVVNGVESFQVLYGIDTNFPPNFSINAWTTADNITPNATICLQSQYLCEVGNLINNLREGIPVALKIGLLIVSPEVTGVDSAGQQFTILDVAVAGPNDNRLRKAYTTTVTLRNLTL